MKRTMSLAVLIRECVEKAAGAKGVGCDFFVADDLYPLKQETMDELRRVLTALVGNALEMLPAGETIFLSVENAAVEQGSTLPLEPGMYVKISLNDLSAFIPADDIGCRWHICVESHGTSGATATLYVPASVGAGPEKEPVAEGAGAACRAKILVMDDEETIRELIRDFLESFGHSVEFAGEGSEAIEKYKQAKEAGKPFDAVILDLNIQRGMDGKETIKKLLEIDPEVRALASSGFPDDPVMLDFKGYGFKGAIAKPCSMTRLHSVLHRILGSGD